METRLGISAEDADIEEEVPVRKEDGCDTNCDGQGRMAHARQDRSLVKHTGVTEVEIAHMTEHWMWSVLNDYESVALSQE